MGNNVFDSAFETIFFESISLKMTLVKSSGIGAENAGLLSSINIIKKTINRYSLRKIIIYLSV